MRNPKQHFCEVGDVEKQQTKKIKNFPPYQRNPVISVWTKMAIIQINLAAFSF